MKKKIIGILLCMVLLTTCFPASGNLELIRINDNNFESGHDIFLYDPLEGGWIEERDGVTILHVSGSNYEMGYQYGSLLKDEIQENLRAQLFYFEDYGFYYDDILEVWHIMKNYLPQPYKDEIHGMADGSGISFDEIAVLNTLPAIFNHASCISVAAWGSTTQDGELYHLRGLDWSLLIRDPETGTYLQENLVLIVRNPDNGYASLYPEFAGNICSWGGINEKGIGIGEMTCLTNDTTFHGISAAFRMRMVLDHASTAEEALNIMSSNRTCGWNFIISDGKIPIGYVVGQTANLLYVGEWDNPVESTCPFWEIEDVVRRLPMFISPECAAVEEYRNYYDPSGLRGFLMFLLAKNWHFNGWIEYKALSKEIERQWGKLNLNSTMSMLRDLYLGKTRSLFSLSVKLFGVFPALFQWVACPETGDMVVSFASVDKGACENPVHYFNMYKLLEAEPPP